MKVLYLHSEPVDSKKANLIQVKSMCAAMGRAGLKVTLSLPAVKKEQADAGINNSLFNLDLRPIKPENWRWKKYLDGKSIRALVERNDPELIFLRYPLLLKQVLPTKIPIVFESHNNILHEGNRCLDYYWQHFIVSCLKKHEIKRLVCISAALKEYWLSRGVDPDTIVVAHDGFSQEQFKLEKSRVESRKKLGLPLEKKIMSYVGSLYQDRKIENILELARAYPDALCLVIGGPEDQKAFYQDAAHFRGIKNVLFFGHVAHELVPDYLFASDVLLALWSAEVSTINYCSPLKLFEYMASGRLIIAHSFPTIKEVLSDQVNALLVEPDSPDDLIRVVGEVLSMTYPNHLAEQARQDAFLKYSWDQRVKSIFYGVEKA